MTSKIRTCLWFEKDGLAAAKFYTALIPNSRIESEHLLGHQEPLLIDVTLAGAPYQILNAGPRFTLSEAASISVLANDQAEIDRLWDALASNGGQESQCGWLKDRWGVSWQIYPQSLLEMQSSDDSAAAERVRQAMYPMKKLKIDELEAAFAGSL